MVNTLNVRMVNGYRVEATFVQFNYIFLFLGHCATSIKSLVLPININGIPNMNITLNINRTIDWEWRPHGQFFPQRSLFRIRSVIHFPELGQWFQWLMVGIFGTSFRINIDGSTLGALFIIVKFYSVTDSETKQAFTFYEYS